MQLILADYIKCIDDAFRAFQADRDAFILDALNTRESILKLNNKKYHFDPSQLAELNEAKAAIESNQMDVYSYDNERVPKMLKILDTETSVGGIGLSDLYFDELSQWDKITYDAVVFKIIGQFMMRELLYISPPFEQAELNQQTINLANLNSFKRDLIFPYFKHLIESDIAVETVQKVLEKGKLALPKPNAASISDSNANSTAITRLIAGFATYGPVNQTAARIIMDIYEILSFEPSAAAGMQAMKRVLEEQGEPFSQVNPVNLLKQLQDIGEERKNKWYMKNEQTGFFSKLLPARSTRGKDLYAALSELNLDNLDESVVAAFRARVGVTAVIIPPHFMRPE